MNRADTDEAVRRQASQNWKAVGNFPKFVRENFDLLRTELVRGKGSPGVRGAVLRLLRPFLSWLGVETRQA